MKKKARANLIMVAIIILIAAAGILGVGYIQGWFDTAEGKAVLQEVTGLVWLQRDGVSYEVMQDTVLRADDQITAQKGATAVIALGEDRIILGSGAQLTVTDPAIGTCAFQANAGELFVNTASSVRLTFELGDVTICDSTAALSIRSGAQTISVFRGTVAEANAGKQVEYVQDTVTVRDMQLKGLNDFMIGQIRQTGKTVTLYYTEEDLKTLELERQQTLQDMLSDRNSPTQHVHNYGVRIVVANCLSAGYTEYTCQCGDRYTRDETPALGHRWRDWENGIRSCRNCNATEEQLPEESSKEETLKEETPEEETPEEETPEEETPEEETPEEETPEEETPEEETPKEETPEEETPEEETPEEETPKEETPEEETPEEETPKEETPEEETPKEETPEEETPEEETPKEDTPDQSEPQGHSHRYAATVIAPGCTTGGYTQYLCQCGESYTDQETEAVGHSWGQWIIIREATTTEKGLRERRCQSCDIVEEEPVEKLAEGHSHTYTQVVVAPTCTVDGYTLYSCACGMVYTDSPTRATGHRYESQVVAPTCTVQGYTRHTCACGVTYTDGVTNATGHSWGVWMTIREATDALEGLRERTCGSCGKKEEKTIPKLPEVHIHSYTAQQILPTCTVQGYTLHSCACGDAYTDSPVSAKGHSWSDWVTIREVTDSAEGLQERSCKDCDTKEQTTIPIPDPAVGGYVYISIVCDTILNNMEDLSPGKVEFVPYDGVILPMVEVAYYDGETVFDVLRRVCERTDIQLEYSWTPLYDSYYIEGIHNLYEFDCGEQSGWMYKVNEWFPNYGCSGYEVSDGDVIVWCYTCQGLGADVGEVVG